MQSRKWLGNIVAVVSAAIFLVSGAIAFAGSTPEDTAYELYQMIYSKYGTSDAMNNNIILPMTTDTPMTTVDGSVSFYVPSTMCESTTAFLTIGMIPLSSGDIGSLTISQDLDADGSVEYSWMSPFVVSGICEKGVLSCDAGTWENCVAYEWYSDSNGKMSVKSQSDAAALGSCYCINNNCGSNLVINQLSYILYSLGAGIVSELQDATAGKYLIADGTINGMTIVYSGQATGECADNSNTSGLGVDNAVVSELTAIYNTESPTAIDAAAEEALEEASLNSDSTYSSIVNSASATGKEMSTPTCSIIRSVTMDVETTDAYYVWQNWLNVSIECVFESGCANCTATVQYDSNEDAALDKTQTTTFESCSNSESELAAEADTSISGMQELYGIPVNWTKKNSATYTFEYGSGSGNWGNVAKYSLTVEKITTPVCNDSDEILNTADLKCYTETLLETMMDNCSAIMEDSSCELHDETIDGVETMKDGVLTYLMPTESCKTATGVMTSEEACRDWWQKDRTYWCPSDSDYDLTYALERTGTVISSTEESSDGSTLTYTDVQLDDEGNQTYDNNSILLPQLMEGENCINACMTQRPITNTTATGDTTAVDTLESSITYDYYYIQCTDDNECPLDESTGEVIVTDCSCLNEAGEAIATMEVMNAAVKDMICSSTEEDE